MYTMYPPLLISSISDFSMLEKILNSDELLLLPSLEHLKPWCSFISGPTLSLSMFCLPSLFTFNCPTCYLCLFSSCHLEPVLFQWLYPRLKVWPCMVVIIPLYAVVIALSDRSTVLAIGLKKGMIWQIKLCSCSCLQFIYGGTFNYPKKATWKTHHSYEQ